MKPTEIQNLIKFVAKSGVSEVEIEDKDFKITIKTPPHKKGKLIVETQQPVMQVQAPVATPLVAAQAHKYPASNPSQPANRAAFPVLHWSLRQQILDCILQVQIYSNHS